MPQSKRLRPAVHGLLATPSGELAGVAAALSLGMVALTASAFGVGAGPTTVALAGFLAATAVAGRALWRFYPHDHLGLCNAVTLARLALTMALVAPLVAGSAPGWSVFAVAAVALALDGVDGWLARAQGYVSDFGARFDMEVDSALALILAASAAMTAGLGPLAILLGLPRYGYAAAARVLPWMRHAAPERFGRKAVCVVQLGVLIALQAPILPTWLGGLLALVAAGALTWSFAVDIAWLWRRRQA